MNMMAWAGALAGRARGHLRRRRGEGRGPLGLHRRVDPPRAVARERRHGRPGPASTYVWTCYLRGARLQDAAGTTSPWVPASPCGASRRPAAVHAQDRVQELYGCNKQSALGKAMMGVSGQSMLRAASPHRPPRASRRRRPSTKKWKSSAAPWWPPRSPRPTESRSRRRAYLGGGDLRRHRARLK